MCRIIGLDDLHHLYTISALDSPSLRCHASTVPTIEAHWLHSHDSTCGNLGADPVARCHHWYVTLGELEDDIVARIDNGHYGAVFSSAVAQVDMCEPSRS